MIKIDNLSEKYIVYKNQEERISFSENGRRYEAVNKDRKNIQGFQVDNKKLISDKNKKCDYCLVVENNENYVWFLIELKGSDIVTACQQIEKTIENFKINYKTERFVARIVASKVRTQELNTNEYKRFEKKMKDIKKNNDIKYEAVKKSSRCLSDVI